MKIYRRKNVGKGRQFPSYEEIVEIMYNKELNYNGCEILDVLYSNDRTKRFVILKSRSDFMTYSFERLQVYDEEEFVYFGKGALPAYWLPRNEGAKPVFNDFETSLNELKATPEYKTFFADVKD